MPTCQKCHGPFPNRIKIGGVIKNLSSRRYCLSCSPVGEHNTKQIHIDKDVSSWMEIPCAECGKSYKERKRKLFDTVCHVCYNHRSEKRQADKVHGLVGDSCWLCGYSKGIVGRKVLHFHHVGVKVFPLSTREYSHRTWESVLLELRKCTPVCPTCHSEIHVGYS